MLNKSLFRILFIFLVLTNFFYAQVPKEKVDIEKTYSTLKVAKNDTAKVESLIELYKNSIRQGAIRKEILEEALIISEMIYYIDGIAKCYNRMGITARYESDYNKSVNFHKRSLNYFEKSTDTLSKIKCLNSLGVTYRKLNLEKEAFEQYFLALNLSEKIDNKKSIAIALNGMGNALINTEKYDKALVYFRRALDIEKNIDNIKGQEYEYANIGEVYLNKKLYDSARFYINKSLELAIKNPRKEGVAIKYNLLGLLSQKEGDYKQSTSYYKKAIPQLIKYNSLRYLSNTQINIGVNQLNSKEYAKALININQGLSSAKLVHSKENISLGYNALTEYYTQTNDFENALMAHKNATKFHDSIVNLATQKSIISTQIEYETQRKDSQIKKLAKEKELSIIEAKSNSIKLIIGSLISIIVIVLLLLFIYLLRKNKELEIKNQNSELQKYILQVNKLENLVKNNSSKSNQSILENIKTFELSTRETEVLEHIARGFSNSEIASEMFVSTNTVKTHIKNIYSKLDVKNRIQAMKKVNDF